MDESSADLEISEIRLPKTQLGKDFYSQNFEKEKERQKKTGVQLDNATTNRHARERTADQLLAYRERDKSERDSLTGLLNRRGFDRRFEEEIQRTKRFNKPLTLIFMDLNQMKEVNDDKGYRAGDELIKKTAKILAGTREYDIVARWGGDEFGILLPHESEEKALEFWDRVNKAFEQEGISISAGYIQIDKSSKGAIEESRDLCEKAMKAAKTKSKEEKRNIMMHPSSLGNDEILRVA